MNLQVGRGSYKHLQISVTCPFFSSHQRGLYWSSVASRPCISPDLLPRLPDRKKDCYIYTQNDLGYQSVTWTCIKSNDFTGFVDSSLCENPPQGPKSDENICFLYVTVGSFCYVFPLTNWHKRNTLGFLRCELLHF